MSQNINLSVSGIYTSLNDFQGLPQGALDIADNVESRYKNVMEPRRGFEELPLAAMDFLYFARLTNFYVGGIDRIVGLTSDGDLAYYTGANPWPAIPGDYASDIVAPNAINAKCRFVHAGQNLYVTAQDGVRSLSSGTAAEILRAGVPKGLNLEAVTNGDSSGFFSNNTQVTTTGTVTNTSAFITQVDDPTSIEIDQYVSGVAIPSGTKVIDITPSATVLAEAADTTAGSPTIANVAGAGILAMGMLVTGTGIPDGAKIFALPGGTNVTLDVNAFQTATGSIITFSTSIIITMDQNATGSHTSETLVFYSGAQVGYRMVFGRVETDVNGTNLTRLGSPSSIAIATTTSGTSTNTTVTGTLPKNSDGEITFVRLYRSPQTDSVSITPLDQYSLVYERQLVDADFIARVITITDDVPDSLVGIPLYAGSDQEGILQSNDPPPMCWDMCKFRDFVLYGNITRPTSTKFTIVAVGVTGGGVQVGDQINISGSFLGDSFSESYIGATGEVAAARRFKIFTTGTPSQNIADTANSLIRVVNFDNSLPVHSILLSSSTDLPGQILLEADYPNYDTFSVNASAHQDAYDPSLDDLISDINTLNNGIGVSKTGEFEAVPATNLLYAGDTSSPILRIIPLRDYVIVLKTDGIYKIQGLNPQGLVSASFDLTTKIIGAETAVSLNSGVWMLSNQGVVSISDGGVDAKSIPIDDQLNRLIGSHLDNLVDVSFAVGYESDRKYILAVPDSDNPYAEVQYNFNYVTNAWTTWSRNLHTGFIHSNEGKLYIGRADTDSSADPQAKGVSKERKNGTYKDYVDEGIANVILSIDDDQVVLDSIDSVEAGDILFQDSTHFSPIISVDLLTNTVTLQYTLSFSTGAVEILKAFTCTMTWKQVFGDNPAFMRQFAEGIALFKNTRFNVATAMFVTDFSQSSSSVPLAGTGIGLWGLFPWGELPWGGTILPSKIRFLIPQDKQLGSYLLPTMIIKQGYSDFKFQGMSISYYNLSQEVGK